MTEPSHLGAGVGAGVIVLVVTTMPVALIAIAGANGSLGDLSQVELLGAGILLAAVISGFAGYGMMRSLRRAEAQHRSQLDAWAAFFVGLALFIFLITLVPALILLALIPDEGQSLSSQIAGPAAVWFGGYVVAAVAGAATARAFFGRGRMR
jgi:hypothetical protein